MNTMVQYNVISIFDPGHKLEIILYKILRSFSKFNNIVTY